MALHALQAKPKTLPLADERRRFQRVRVNLLGRYMLSDRQEYPCQVANMSPGGMALIAPVNGQEGERVIAYIDHLGRLEGMLLHDQLQRVQRRLDGASGRPSLQRGHGHFVALAEAVDHFCGIGFGIVGQDEIIGARHNIGDCRPAQVHHQSGVHAVAVAARLRLGHVGLVPGSGDRGRRLLGGGPEIDVEQVL